MIFNHIYQDKVNDQIIPIPARKDMILKKICITVGYPYQTLLELVKLMYIAMTPAKNLRICISHIA